MTNSRSSNTPREFRYLRRSIKKADRENEVSRSVIKNISYINNFLWTNNVKCFNSYESLYNKFENLHNNYSRLYSIYSDLKNENNNAENSIH